MAANSYRDAARRNFEALRKLYNTNDDLDCQSAVSFWRLGNAFDTMIDYLDVIDHTGAPDIQKMVRNQFNASAMCLGGLDKAWFDDFGRRFLAQLSLRLAKQPRATQCHGATGLPEHAARRC